jgi:hypothetical protein
MSDDVLHSTLKSILKIAFTTQIELAALQMLLIEKGIVDNEALERYRAECREQAKPALDRLGHESAPDTILEMLRRFEGPPQ